MYPSHTYWLFIERLSHRHIISGYADGTFHPGNSNMRGQLAKIDANAGEFNEPVSGQTFTDVPTDHTFYLFKEMVLSIVWSSTWSSNSNKKPGHRNIRAKIVPKLW